MYNSETDITLTNESWDVTTHRDYHVTFLNERNAIREVLYDLLQADNEIKCINVDIQDLKTSFELQLNGYEAEVRRLPENEHLDLEQRNQLIAEQVKKIEETNLAFSREIEKYQLIKDNKCKAVCQNVDKLFRAKSQFKFTHQKQVESLRRFRIFCDRNIRPAVDVRLKSIDRKFCDELFYIDSYEKGLKHIFSLIDDRSSHSGICASVSSTSAVSNNMCSEFLTDFAWMRNEQLTKRSELFKYFMKYIAKHLIEALAAMHIHKPNDPIKFIANYLKHLKQNEFRVRKQESIIAAAKYGELLCPEKTD